LSKPSSPDWGLPLRGAYVHPPKPFITPAVFKDRNLSAGLLVMFAVGMVLLSVSALLAPWLQELGNYLVETAGLVMAPRGFGTMAAMLIAGRLSNKVDARLLMAFGIVVLSWSLYRMTDWTPAVSETTMVANTILQGAGLGFVFIPLQVIAFATLDPALRTEGTPLLSLLRNVGGAIGISVTGAMVTQIGQIEHSVLTGYITPLSREFQNAEIIAYNDDWKLMMLTSLPMLFLLLLMPGPKKGAGGGADHAGYRLTCAAKCLEERNSSARPKETGFPPHSPMPWSHRSLGKISPLKRMSGGSGVNLR
jgi:MFS transporter, DHA2 family, multidrug resistance protein